MNANESWRGRGIGTGCSAKTGGSSMLLVEAPKIDCRGRALLVKGQILTPGVQLKEFLQPALFLSQSQSTAPPKEKLQNPS